METTGSEVPRKVQRTSRRRDKVVRSRKALQDVSGCGQPKMTTKTRFQWRYKNRACFEQMRIQHEAGKEVPLSRQMFYVTDSSEGEETDLLKQHTKTSEVDSLSLSDLNGMAEGKTSSSVNSSIQRVMSSDEDIEWDYSDIQLAAQNIPDEGPVDSNPLDTRQILPNFEEFDQVELETEVFVRPPRMGTRSLRKPADQLLKVVTLFSVKPEGNLSSQSLLPSRDSFKSDSGIQDVFNGTNTRDDSSQEKSGNSDCLNVDEPKLNGSIEALENLEYYAHQPEKRSKEDIDNLLPDCFNVCKENLNSRINSEIDQQKLPISDASPKKPERKSRSEERTSSPELDDQKPLYQFESSKDDGWWKSRSQSLDVSQSSSFYDSLEGTPRSRLNWSVEHLHEGYDIKCVLCKSRHKCKSHSLHKHVLNFQNEEGSDEHEELHSHKKHTPEDHNYEKTKRQQSIFHPMGILTREEVFIKPSSPVIEKDTPLWSDKLETVENVRTEGETTDRNDRTWIKSENKHRPAAKTKFEELVKKWEGATQNPHIGIKRSLSFDGIQKTSDRQKEYIPQAYRRNVQEMSKDFAKKTKEQISRSPSKEEKCVDNLRIRSNSFTLGLTTKTASAHRSKIRTSKEKPDLPLASRNQTTPQKPRKNTQDDESHEKAVKAQRPKENDDCQTDDHHIIDEHQLKEEIPEVHQSNFSIKLHEGKTSDSVASFNIDQVAKPTHLKVYNTGSTNERLSTSGLSTEKDEEYLLQTEVVQNKIKLQRNPGPKYADQLMNDQNNGHSSIKAGKNIAILDFSETEPTVRFNIQDNKESKCSHIYHVIYSPTEEKTVVSGPQIDKNKRSNDDKEELFKVNATVGFEVDQAETSESSHSSSSALSLIDNSMDEEERTLSDESVIQSAVPVHVYRSCCMIEKQVIGTSNMEFWYTQLLGVHRLILLARICDRFGIRRWKSKKKRHVTVFNRDNFLVVCEKSDRSGDMSREECSFDVSWSPEFMSTPRDMQSQEMEEKQFDSNVAGGPLGDDSFGFVDYTTPETVREALERIMNGKMHVKLSKKKPKRSEVHIEIQDQQRDKPVSDRHYSQFQRTTDVKPSGHCRTFDDLQFSSGYSEESYVEKTGDTSIWDSYLDSGYDFGRVAAHDRSENTSGTLSDSTLLESTLSDTSIQDRANCAISEVIEKSVSPVSGESQSDFENRPNKSKKKYATTIVILTTEASDTSMSEEEGDQKMTFSSSKSKVDGRYISAFSIPSLNTAIPKGGHQKVVISKRRRRRPKAEGVGLHRFICLDMPLKVWPVNNCVSHVLPIQHIEMDTANTDGSSKMELELKPPMMGKANGDVNQNQQAEIEDFLDKWKSDESYDSFISSDETITEVTQDTTSTSETLDDGNKADEDGNSTSNESALGTSNCSERTDFSKEPIRSTTFTNLTSVNTLLAQHIEKQPVVTAVKSESYLYVRNSMPQVGSPPKRFSSGISNVVLSPCTLPLASNSSDQINPNQDGLVNSTIMPHPVTWSEGSQNKVQMKKGSHDSNLGYDAILCDPCPWKENVSSAIDTPSVIRDNVPTEEKKGRKVKLEFKEVQNVPHQSPNRVLSQSAGAVFANQPWEKEQWDMHFGSSGHSGPIINFPGGSRDLSARDVQDAFSFNTAIEDVNYPLLGESYNGQVKFGENNNIYQSRNRIDTSFNDTYTDLVEDDMFKLNKSYSQIENSTRILRVMDFAADGVDLMALLNKVSRSQSCPDLSMERFECSTATIQAVQTESLPTTTENILALNTESQNFSFSSIVSDALSEESSNEDFEADQNIANQMRGRENLEEMAFDNISQDKHPQLTDPNQQVLKNNEVDDCEQQNPQTRSDETWVSPFGGSYERRGNSDIIVNTKKLISAEQELQQLIPNFQQGKGSIDVGQLIPRVSHAFPCIDEKLSANANPTENLFDVEEEASISVNVSFEVEFSQKMAKSDKVQNLLKDCQVLKEGLLQDVAQITQEMTRDIKQNISDESLQLEWLYDEKKGCEDGRDEMVYFTLSGNKSMNVPGNVNHSNSGRSSSSGCLNQSCPELNKVIMRTLDIPQECHLVPVNIGKSELDSPQEEVVPYFHADNIDATQLDHGTGDIPVRIFLEDGSSRTENNELTVQYVNEGDVHEMWGSQTDIRVCEIDLPEQGLSLGHDESSESLSDHYKRLNVSEELEDYDGCYTEQKRYYQDDMFCHGVTEDSESVNESASFCERGKVALLKDMCLLSLNGSRSSSEESFPGLMNTSFRDRNRPRGKSNERYHGSEVNLSLVSLSDLSGGTPSPRVHHIIRSQNGQTLKLIKGNLSASDNEYINFIDYRNKTWFDMELGSGRCCYPGNYSQCLDLTWPWLGTDLRLKRCFSADDLSDYEKRNYMQDSRGLLCSEVSCSESNVCGRKYMADVSDNVNSNNNNNGSDMRDIEEMECLLLKDSTLSGSSRHDVDYGKFYNISYLQTPKGNYLKGPSLNPTEKPKSPHYHRPDNFSYTQVRRDFIKPLKKGMMSALGDSMSRSTQKKRLEDYMEEPMKNAEVIQLACFPDNIKYEQERLARIEREDFPGPPATAVAHPELLYKQFKTSKRRAKTESDLDSPDGFMDIDDEENVPVDPKLLKDIDQLRKIENKSGVGKIILEELKKKSKEPPPALDPVSASRTPSASKEPHYKTRYESHVFASPSRDLDYRPRVYSLDDQAVGRKYRSALQSVGNFPVDRCVRLYEHGKGGSCHYTVMKPGYTLRQPKTAHMPSTFASARSNGYFSDIEQCVTRDSDFEEIDQRRTERLDFLNRRSFELNRRSQEMDRRSQEVIHEEVRGMADKPDGRTNDLDRRSQKSHSLYTSQSSIEEYDPITGLRRGAKLRGSSVSSDFKMPYRKTLASYMHTDEPPQIFPYDQLKITNLELPPGVDRNSIELHLSDEDFNKFFRMPRSEFYRLAEWKRNDMKQRVALF